MTARFELYYRPVHPHYAKEGRNTFSEYARMQIKQEKANENGGAPPHVTTVYGENHCITAAGAS